MFKSTATWNGQVIAESDNCVAFDNNTYFPPDALKREFLTPSSHTSVCPWKGTASYMDVVVEGKTNADAMWMYNDPKPAASLIKGHVAFWKGVAVTGAEFARKA